MISGNKQPTTLTGNEEISGNCHAGSGGPQHEISCMLNGMIDVNEIHSLSEFQRNSREFIRKLKRSGKPAVLTVNGQAEVVVQSAAAYQSLLDDREFVETIRGIGRGLEEAKRGKGRPMLALLEEIADKHGIALK